MKFEKINANNSFSHSFFSFISSVEFAHLNVFAGRLTPTKKVVLFFFLLVINAIIHCAIILAKVFLLLCAYYSVVYMFPELHVFRRGQ